MMNTKLCLPVLVGIFLFPWALQAQNKFTTVSELENYFRIQDEVLINFQGERYPKIAFEDPLHENLAYLLKDPEQALVIHQAYARHIRPHLPEECRQPFSNALAKVCFLFGSEKFSPENSLLAALKEESPSRSAPLQKFLEQFRRQSRSNRRSQVDSYCINTDQLAKPAVVDLSELSRPKLSQEFLQRGTREWTDLHPELISLFVNEANRPARPNPVKEIRSEYTIVILTTSASGGNYSVTRAMESFFSPYPAIRTIIVDVETVAEETDPVMLATGATTYDGIYRLFQQEYKGMGPLLERFGKKQMGSNCSKWE